MLGYGPTPMDMSSHSEKKDARRPRKVAIIASYAPSLINFQLELLKELVAAGHTVEALAPEDDADVARALEAIGVRFVRIPMSRTGTNPLQDIRTLFALWAYFVRSRCEVVLPYTMKPVIYGCLGARLAGIADRFALMTGLGYVFSSENASLAQRVVRWISVLLYRLALAGTKRVFVYNDADADDLLAHRIVADPGRLMRVAGSGVDLQHFPASPPPPGSVFLLVARLLRQKGVCEFVEAARLLRQRHPHAQFRLLGRVDENPTGLSMSEIEAWVKEGAITYLGETRDVRPHLANCSTFVLPSYYREGIPRSILEAMATGRSVVTTTMPGCRDTVVEGMNGFLVPPRDAAALAKAMETFILEPSLAKIMGERSRRLAEERFDVKSVNRRLLTAMKLDRNSAGP